MRRGAPVWVRKALGRVNDFFKEEPPLRPEVRKLAAQAERLMRQRLSPESQKQLGPPFFQEREH